MQFFVYLMYVVIAVCGFGAVIYDIINRDK